MEHDFVVSALKYRPDSFDSVVGQTAITNTLKNAIRNEHIGKAFLFCGPRGVGKTTCARILAKVINCANPTEKIEACGECESCKSFQEGHSLNVHELDAASNNKVEHIRELIEQVRLAPQVGSYKAYIIDEVHMLSQQAFNAFLKTLEEPPDHAIFILATTEKHKVLPTILSRCQIYDFHRIGIKDIADHLSQIAQQEGIEAEYDALHTIAAKADGALRDALTIFDQLVASSGKQLSYQHVVESLNILDHEHFFTLTDQLLQGDVPQAVLSFNDVLQRGFDGQHFLNGLARHFRDLLMARDEQTLPLLEVSEELQKRFSEQAKRCDPELLIEGLNKISEADSEYRNSKDQRLLVELTLLRLCRMMNPEELKKKPVEGASEAVKTEAKGQNAPTPDEKQETPKEEPSEKEEEAAGPDATQSGTIETEGAAETEAPQTGTDEEAVEEDPPQDQTIEEEAAKAETLQNETVEEEAAEAKAPQSGPIEAEPTETDHSGASEKSAAPPVEGKRKRMKGMGDSLRISQFREEEKNGSGEADVLETPEEEKRAEEFSVEDLKKAWKDFLEGKKENNGLIAVLRNIMPVREEGEKVVLQVNTTMEKERVREVSTELLGHLKSALKNDRVELDVRLEKSEGDEGQPAYYTAKQQFDRMVEKNPNIKDLRDRFDLDLER